MLISTAFAHDSGNAGTGSSGGGIALLIILGSVILLYILHSAVKKWHRRKLEHASSDQ